MSFRASIITPAHIDIHCGIVIVLRSLGVEIYSLVADTSMCPEIFFKIFRHWVTRLSLEISGESIRGPVVVIIATLPTVRRKKLHQILVLSDKLLQNFCSSC